MANFKKPLQTLVVNATADALPLFYTVDAKGNYNLVETDDIQTLAANLRTGNTEGAGYLPDADGTMADPDAGGAGTAIVAADLARMRIAGFADFNKGLIPQVIKTKSAPGQPQIATVTYVVSSAVAGEEVILPVYFESDNTEAEMASGANYLFTFRKPRYYQFFVAAGDDATAIAVKLVAAINADKYTLLTTPLTATNSAGVVTITGRTNGLRFYVATDNLSGSSFGNAVTSGHISQTFAVTQQPFEGRGRYQQLRTLRLQTESNIYPYSPDLVQQPLVGGAYSTYRITQTVLRADLGGTDSANTIPIGTFEYLIYVEQTGGSAFITALDAWFNANATVKKNYPATTAAGAIAAETVGATLT